MTSVPSSIADPQPRVAVYLRVSTEEQRERESIKTQREALERYCALHGIQVHDYYNDDGVSGTKPLGDRPEGSRLLRDARARHYDTVLIYKLDRLGRDTLVSLTALRELETLGIRLVSITEHFDNTPAGRLMAGVLSSFASHEREMIVERSVAGTNRLAREGAWLGGIVPYGYRVEGKDRASRLVVSEERLPGTTTSEADVIRLIYQWIADEHSSCVQVAARLNEMGVPPAYTRDGRQLLRGKRKVTTSGIWRPSRVRNLIVSTTYKGVHLYGKRSTRQRELIERAVPAIVTVDLWERAQQVLRSNQLFSKRNARRQYLLRGLLKCGLCGLTFCGIGYRSVGGQIKTWYKCDGRASARGVYGLNGQRCPSKSISSEVEEVLWSDIEAFLRNPGNVLGILAERLNAQGSEADRVAEALAEIEATLARKQAEVDAVVTLYREGRIDGEVLGRQLDIIQREEEVLKKQLAALKDEQSQAATVSTQLRTAESLLRDLNERLDQPLTFELKHHLIEILVDRIRVDTVERDGRREVAATVTYRFTPIVNCTGTGSWHRRA
jgi:site-specific DNA recombinase